MAVLINPHRGAGLAGAGPWPSTDAGAVAALLARCPKAAETPLLAAPGLAVGAGVGAVFLKDETGRMGLGSFKALGAAYVIARDAAEGRAAGRTYVAASAGNHGLSVAAGARTFGAMAVVVLAETVPQSFAERLASEGAEVRRAGKVYGDSLAAAMEMAREHGWQLLSDSSWPGYLDVPRRVMEGYLQLCAEAAGQMPEQPSHIFVQAGVGGLAAAVAAHARKVWGNGPVIVVVEPDAAPALMQGIRVGKVVFADGPVSNMGRLDCKEASLIALQGLARDADIFLTVSDAAAEDAVRQVAKAGPSTTPSGAAGVAGLLSGAAELGLTSEARVLCVISETGESG
ncbi:MAG: pyridoxal-phosphate dependent enzyme [Rhodobacteraceae bacterium]|nr:pyridoxal-phosphate dependent enzyme [Paracoccaceae bacterium]